MQIIMPFPPSQPASSSVDCHVSRCGYQPWSNFISPHAKCGIAQVMSFGQKTTSHPLFSAIDPNTISSTFTFKHNQWAWETCVDPTIDSPVDPPSYQFSYTLLNTSWARESSVDLLKHSKSKLLPSKSKDNLKSFPTACSSTQVDIPEIESKLTLTISAHSIEKEASIPSIEDPITKEISDHATHSKNEPANGKEKPKRNKPCQPKKLSGCQKRKKNKAKAEAASNQAKECQKSHTPPEKRAKLILGVVRCGSRTGKVPPPLRAGRKGDTNKN